MKTFSFLKESFINNFFVCKVHPTFRVMDKEYVPPISYHMVGS